MSDKDGRRKTPASWHSKEPSTEHKLVENSAKNTERGEEEYVLAYLLSHFERTAFTSYLVHLRAGKYDPRPRVRSGELGEGAGAAYVHIHYVCRTGKSNEMWKTENKQRSHEIALYNK